MWSYRRNVSTYVVFLCTFCGAIAVLVNINATLRQSKYRWLLPHISSYHGATLRHENDDARTDSRRNTQLHQQELLERMLDTITPGVGQVTHLRLVNATNDNTGQPLIDPLVNGTIINLQNYPANQQFSIEAMVSNATGPIGSIRFVNIDGKRITDNFVKYALCGDKKGSFTNCSALSIVGTNYSISATPYSLSNVSGVAGATHTIYFSIVNNTSPPGWVIVNPAAPIVKRHESCFVLVGRNAYVVAGRAKRNVEIYNVINRTWSLGAKPPIQIHHTQCVVADNKIWIVSSWTGGYPMEANTDVIYIYDPATDKWSTKPGLPESRRRGGAASVLVGRRIYVSHGNRGGHETGNFSTSLNWLDYYDLDLNIWVTNLTDAPHVRDHTGGVYVNGEICIAGGRDGGSIDFFNQVVLPTDCYNPVTGTWTVRANIPQGRAGSAYGLTCDGKMIVAGGEGLGHAWSNVDIFNGTHWTSADPLNIARHGTGLAIDCTCNQIYIAAGSIVQGGSNETSSVETYFPNGVDVPCLA